MAFDPRKLTPPPVTPDDPILRPNLPAIPHSRPGARAVPGFGGKADHEKLSGGSRRRGYSRPID